MPKIISCLVKQHALAIYFNLEFRNTIFWLCNDYLYFKCSCALNWNSLFDTVYYVTQVSIIYCKLILARGSR